MKAEGCFQPFLTFASYAVCAPGLAQRRAQAGAWLCTPGAALPLPRSSSRVLCQATGASLQLLFVGLPSVLGADFFFAPREISLQEGLEHFCEKIIFLL